MSKLFVTDLVCWIRLMEWFLLASFLKLAVATEGVVILFRRLVSGMSLAAAALHPFNVVFFWRS